MADQAAMARAGTAAVLSFVFTGVGQIYNGQIKKGLLLVAVTTFGLLSVLLGALFFGFGIFYGLLFSRMMVFSLGAIVLGGLIVCWTGIYGIADAYRSALR